MIGAVVVGDYELATTSADNVLADHPMPVTEYAAHFVLGFSSFLTGQVAQAENEYNEMERLAVTGIDIHIPDLFSGPVSSAANLGLVACLRGREDIADAQLATAEARAATDSDRVLVEQHHCWINAMRGDARSARDHAIASIALAERLEFNAYVIAASIVGGWADAMVGDAAGAARADAAYAEFLRMSHHADSPLCHAPSRGARRLRRRRGCASARH